MKRYALLKRSQDQGLMAICKLGPKRVWSSTVVYCWQSPPKHLLEKDAFIVRVGSKNCPIKVEKGFGYNRHFVMRSTEGCLLY